VRKVRSVRKVRVVRSADLGVIPRAFSAIITSRDEPPYRQPASDGNAAEQISERAVAVGAARLPGRGLALSERRRAR
jgi:hypothetical protein